MRNTVVGIVIGCVVGVMLGATVIAPRMNAARTDNPTAPPGSEALDDALPPPAEFSPKLGPAPGPGPISSSVPTSLPDSVVSPATPPVPPPIPEGNAGLKLASAFSLRTPDIGVQITHFTDQIRRLSGGTARISVQQPNAPIAPDDFFDAISGGVLDGAFIDPTLWVDHAPALNLFSAIPFGPRMDEFLAWYGSGGGREAFQAIAKGLSMHALACGIAPGEAAGWFRTPVASAQSFQHLRIAAKGPGGRVLARLGAKVSNMKTADIFMAMEEGRLDAAQVSGPSDDSRLGLDQLTHTYYFPGWHKPLTLIALMIREQNWNALSQTRKAQIETACGDTLRRGLGIGEVVQFAALKNLTADGVNIQRLPQSALNVLKKTWRKIAEEEASKDKAFAETWRSLGAFRKNYAIWRELSAP